MRRVVLLGMACVFVACSTPLPARDTTMVRVVRSGFAVRDGRIGAAASIRSDTGRRDIGLRSRFTAGERVVTTVEDVLPFCPAHTDCWWGNSLFDDDIARRSPAIDGVRIDIVDQGAELTDPRTIVKLGFTRDDDEVRLRPPGSDGVVYLVAFDGGAPLFATSFYTQAGDTAVLHYGRALFPIDIDERARAFFYPGPVPRNIGGAAD